MLGQGNAPAESLHLLCGVRVEQLLQLAVAAGLDAQHAEAVLGVMEGDALDRSRQHLGGLRAGLGRIGERRGCHDRAFQWAHACRSQEDRDGYTGFLDKLTGVTPCGMLLATVELFELLIMIVRQFHAAICAHTYLYWYLRLRTSGFGAFSRRVTIPNSLSSRVIF